MATLHSALPFEEVSSIFINNSLIIQPEPFSSSSLSVSIGYHATGWEHGTGIFVSEVHPQSEAQKEGLKVSFLNKSNSI